MLKRKMYDPHAKDANGWSPFLYLVSRQDIEGVQTMLFNGANANDSVWGVSSAHLAALSGNVELLKALLEHDATLAAALDDKFATPLHYAAYGHREAVVELLVKMTSPSMRDLDDHSPLLTAILRKSLPVARLLVQHGALVTHKELWAACQTGSDELLGLLVEMGDLREALLQRASPHGHSVMQKCVMFLSDLECCAIVPMLLQIPGVSVDDVDDNKRTAASYACICGKPNALKLLIACGANLQQRDIYRNNLLHLVTTAVVFDIVQEALGAVAFKSLVGEANMFGWRPLEIARALQANEVLSALLGADPTRPAPVAVEGLVPSWHYRHNIAYTAGAKNDDMLQ
jgi:ankyrin repeat protein